jgi:4-hydroxyphenylpyruvate dioxygenase
MRTSIASVSLSGLLDEKLEAIAAAGFWGVEVFEPDLLGYAGSPAALGRRISELGLECVAYQPFRDFEGLPDGLRAAALDRAERKFDLMGELGAPAMLVCSSVHPAASGDRQRIIGDLRELAERASRRRIAIGYEALAWGRFVNDHRDAWAIVSAADHPALGIILDSFHSFARAVPVESLRDIDVRKITFVQLADAPRLHMDELSWSRHFRTLPGQGDFPIAEYVALLHERGYQGPYSLEIFNDRFRAASARTIATDGYRSLVYLEDQLLRRTGQRGGRGRVECAGLEFVEIAATPVDRPRVARMLSSFGFARSGMHRRKSVERWQQGPLNIVINSDPEGYARSFVLAHDTSVCALGLRVREAAQAVERAQLLRIPVFSQPVASGELAIPAVKGVGGSLLYFVDDPTARTVWNAEFEPVPVVEPGAGLTGWDAVSQVMPYEEMYSSLLLYLSLLEARPTPMIEYADPLGLVQSQAIVSEGAGLRFVLSASAANQTLTSRFLAAATGAGTQYLSFATADIFATAMRLRAQGADILPIGGNYYDDLACRYPELSGQLEILREYNILYDRDAGGDFYHFISRAFDRRFFFEFAQRRGYGGYGTGNAQVRLAAQARFKLPAAS